MLSLPISLKKLTAMNSKDSIFAFIAGAAVGAIAALLFAPEKGSETRARIARKAEEAKSLADELKESLRETGNGLKESVRERALDRLDALERYLEKL